jgi:predicted RNA-binding Zn-ribbon protein involved in translation (DUF1610 family)
MSIEYEMTGTWFAKSYSEVPARARVVAVNGRAAIGACIGCGHPILEGQKYTLYAEGERACPKCGSEEDAMTGDTTDAG